MDISEEVVDHYRTLREKVSPFAEELSFSNDDLLQALSCLKKDANNNFLTSKSCSAVDTRKYANVLAF